MGWFMWFFAVIMASSFGIFLELEEITHENLRGLMVLHILVSFFGMFAAWFWAKEPF